MKKLFVMLIVVLLVVSTVYSNGVEEKTAENKPVEILFWHTFSEGKEIETFTQIKKDFEKENPEIKVNSVRMPFDGLQQQVITAVAGDAAPDVMRMDPTWIGKMASMGALVELDRMEGFDDYKKNAVPGPLSSASLEGHYYGLPLGTNTTVAIWNMDLLKAAGITEVPSTIDKLEEMAKKYSNPAEEKYFFTIAGTYTWAMLPWFWSLGGNLTNPEFTQATGYLDSPESIKALSRIASWYKEGLISPAIIGEQPDAWSASTGGKLPLIVDGPWFFSSVTTDFEKKVTMIPSGDGGSVSIVGGEDVVMLEGSKHPEESWKFIQYLLSDNVQLKMANAGFIPTTETALSKLDTSSSPFLGAFVKQLGSTKVRIPSKNYTEIDNLLAMIFEKVIRGKTTADVALKDAAAQVDALLK
ncbi:MAG: extracellular solute-binding protein [Sphaerochaetaceae bacterium]